MLTTCLQFCLCFPVSQLKSSGTTGNICLNRTNEAPLNNPKELLKQVRGAYYNIKEESSDAILVQWKDNSNVTLASNCHAAAPLGQARRWSNKNKKTISAPLTCTCTLCIFGQCLQQIHGWSWSSWPEHRKVPDLYPHQKVVVVNSLLLPDERLYKRCLDAVHTESFRWD